MIAVLIALCFVSISLPQKVTKRIGVIGFYPYSPKEVDAETQVPTKINEKLQRHLEDRLGREFYERLHFAYALMVNFDDLYRVNPGARNSRWKIFTYKVVYFFSKPEIGIKRYEAEIWLDDEGAVLKEIDLPDISRHPEKATIISAREAIKISNQNKFRKDTIEIGFREEDDSIVWRMTRRDDDGTTWWLDISAHTGKVLNKVGAKGIED